MIDINSKVIVTKNGQTDTGRVLGGCFLPVKDERTGQMVQGPFLGFQVQNDRGHTFYAQSEQLTEVAA